MVRDIRHTGIVVKNLEDSLHFYQGLGFDPVKRLEESGPYLDAVLALKGGRVTTVKLALPGGNQLIELVAFDSPAARPRSVRLDDTGPTHLSMTVEDLEAEYRRLKDQGVAFNSAPQVSPDRYAKVAFCRAPEGTFIELVEVLKT